MLLIELAGICGGVYATSGMIHSLLTVIYDAAFKQCTNIQLVNDPQRRSTNTNNPPTVAIGITPNSSPVM
jgi:hypothetical protein